MKELKISRPISIQRDNFLKVNSLKGSGSREVKVVQAKISLGETTPEISKACRKSKDKFQRGN